MTNLDTPVWYIAFGSNLYRPRLLAYLEGNRIPGAPGQQRQTGARDHAAPTADEPHQLPFELYFANESKRWGGGGAAFVDPKTPSTTTIGRRFRLTWGQLEDVWRQENGATEPETASAEQLRSAGQLTGYTGWYQTLLYCGEHADGAPMATITSSHRHPGNPPSRAYLAVIDKGLAELGHTAQQRRDYLAPHRHGS